eukprot:5616712-Pyramimonas_sp.AAC.1
MASTTPQMAPPSMSEKRKRVLTPSRVASSCHKLVPGLPQAPQRGSLELPGWSPDDNLRGPQDGPIWPKTTVWIA